MKLMPTTVNMDGGIGLEINVKSKMPDKLTVAQGLAPLEWGK